MENIIDVIYEEITDSIEERNLTEQEQYEVIKGLQKKLEELFGS